MRFAGDLDEGDDVRITYTSQRSGNEVTIEGPVTEVFTTEDDNDVVHVHRERKNPLKHSYVALVPAELDDGERVVGAVSVTCEATVPDEPRIDAVYTVKFENVRESTLGVVKSCWKQSGLAIERNTCIVDREGDDAS